MRRRGLVLAGVLALSLLAPASCSTLTIERPAPTSGPEAVPTAMLIPFSTAAQTVVTLAPSQQPSPVQAGDTATPLPDLPTAASQSTTSAQASSSLPSPSPLPEPTPDDTVTPASTVPTPTPPIASATPTSLPLSVVWDRLRALMAVPALDGLQPLPRGERDDRFFAIDNALAAGDASPYVLRGLGAAMDRVEVRWDDLEPEPGVFQFERMDELMVEAQRLDFSVLAVVDGTPPWAVPSGQTRGSAVPLDLSEPALLANGDVNPANPWAVFVSTVARRYGARVTAWEVWNEPNSPDFWQGSVADYARLVTVTRQVLQRVDSHPTVLIGGMVADGGAFLTAVARQLCPTGRCAEAPFDGVAWHVYNNPSDAALLASLTHDLLGPFGLSPSVWITEANVPVNDPQAPDDAVVGPDSVSLEQQAAFVLQLDALARSAGVQAVAIYRASDAPEQGHYWGLLRGDMTGRPALYAYATAARWLSHTRFLQPSQPVPGVTMLQFCRPGQLIDVAWSDAPRQTTITIPSSAPAGQLVSVTGLTQPIEAVSGVFRVLLAPASYGSAHTVPLASPVILVVPVQSGAGQPGC